MAIKRLLTAAIALRSLEALPSIAIESAGGRAWASGSVVAALSMASILSAARMSLASSPRFRCALQAEGGPMSGQYVLNSAGRASSALQSSQKLRPLSKSARPCPSPGLQVAACRPNSPLPGPAARSRPRPSSASGRRGEPTFWRRAGCPCNGAGELRPSASVQPPPTQAWRWRQIRKWQQE